MTRCADYSDNQRDPREDGYVECTECGHPLEVHGAAGCPDGGCLCRDAWTITEIRAVRRRAGLPAQYSPFNY